eukprot:4690641-Amphidinium_carterae.1
MLRISLMSGRYTCLAAFEGQCGGYLIDMACARLALPRRGSERLLQGTSVVQNFSWVAVQDWAGLAPVGEITEYQLIV